MNRTKVACSFSCAVLGVVLLVAGPASIAQEGETASGGIRGQVLAADAGAVLAGVRVAIAGLPITRVSGSEGDFVFEAVRPGSYTVVFTKDGYQRHVVSGVVVSAGRFAEVRADLAPEVIDMEEMVVQGGDIVDMDETGLLEIRTESTAVQDSLSADVIGKAGAGDLSGALKLVVGASVSEGKYATVRGLSDRYTGTTLNGVRLPSADPRRRAVPMDLFPSATIESVTVTKTFTPDMSGDFTGGGVDIRTKSVPDQRIFSFSLATEYDSFASMNDNFLSYRGGGAETLAHDGGDRGLPGEALDTLPMFPTFSPKPDPNQVEASATYDRLVSSFFPAMGVREETAPLNGGFSFTFGDRLQTSGGALFGYMLSGTQRHRYDYYDGGTNNNAVISDPSQPIAVVKERSDSKGTDSVLLGGLLNLAFRPAENQDLALRLVANESAEDEARMQVEDTGYPSVEQNQTLHYTERVMRSLQLQGSHKLGSSAGRGLRLDWLASNSYTTQDEPDVRFFRNTFNYDTLSGERPANSTDAQNTRRIFRTIDEQGSSGRLDLGIPFQGFAKREGNVKVGVFADNVDREYEQLSYTYTFSRQLGSILNPTVSENMEFARFETKDEDQLWTDVFTQAKRLGLATNNPPAPNQLLWAIVPIGTDVNYTGDQKIGAAYAMAELPVAPRLRVVAGARAETTGISIVPVNEQFGKVEIIEIQPGGDRAVVEVPQEQAKADVSDDTWLPSIGVIVEATPVMNVRANWSRTLARPTFRELAPVATEEFIFGDEFVGNPDLTVSLISNYDVRWEWFRRPGDVIAASVFYKSIQDPIELISFTAGGRSFVQPVNYEKGLVYGAEVEFRFSGPAASKRLRGLSYGINATFLQSEVEVPESERQSLAPFGLDEETRRLQGQPDRIVNLNVTYDHAASGISTGLFYNYTGRMLLAGAARGVSDGNPSSFDEPFGILDATLKKSLKVGFSLTFKARNLLQQEKRSVYRTPDGEEAVKSARPTAALYAFVLSWDW